VASYGSDNTLFLGNRETQTNFGENYIGKAMVYDRVLSDDEISTNSQKSQYDNITDDNIPKNGLKLYLNPSDPECFKSGDTTCKNLITGGLVQGPSGTPLQTTNTATPANFPTYNSINGGVFDFVGGKGMNVDEDLGVSNSVSKSFWVYKKISSFTYISDTRNSNESFGIWAICNYSNNNVTFRNQVTHNFSPTYNASDPDLLNNWLHILYISDGTKIDLYINGVNESSVTAATTETINKNFRIGCRYTNIEKWTGYMGQIMVYDRALSYDEVRQIYNNQRPKYGL